jgi:transcriptional regulator
MLVHPWDAAVDQTEAWAFVEAQGFGQLVAAGRGRDLPIVVPTQFSVVNGTDGPAIWLHLARPNPIWAAINENPLVVLAVAGDWAFIRAAWKAIDDEDPALGIPTTYYAAVQLVARAEIVTDEVGILQILRHQQADLDPGGGYADPEVHTRRLPGIRGLRLTVQEVRGKFKYGGNVDADHQRAVAERLADRAGPGDLAARAHLLRRANS